MTRDGQQIGGIWFWSCNVWCWKWCSVKLWKRLSFEMLEGAKWFKLCIFYLLNEVDSGLSLGWWWRKWDWKGFHGEAKMLLQVYFVFCLWEDKTFFCGNLVRMEGSRCPSQRTLLCKLQVRFSRLAEVKEAEECSVDLESYAISLTAGCI